MAFTAPLDYCSAIGTFGKAEAGQKAVWAQRVRPRAAGFLVREPQVPMVPKSHLKT